MPYILLPNGNFCSNVTYQISSLEECQLASEVLGLSWGGSRDRSNEAPACYLASNKVYFNQSPSPISENFPGDNAQICRRARGNDSLFNVHNIKQCI